MLYLLSVCLCLCLYYCLDVSLFAILCSVILRPKTRHRYATLAWNKTTEYASYCRHFDSNKQLILLTGDPFFLLSSWPPLSSHPIHRQGVGRCSLRRSSDAHFSQLHFLVDRCGFHRSPERSALCSLLVHTGRTCSTPHSISFMCDQQVNTFILRTRYLQVVLYKWFGSC